MQVSQVHRPGPPMDFGSHYNNQLQYKRLLKSLTLSKNVAADKSIDVNVSHVKWIVVRFLQKSIKKWREPSLKETKTNKKLTFTVKAEFNNQLQIVEDRQDVRLRFAD